MLTSTRHQQGIVLLEALIGVAIFLIGILALMGLQASSIATASDARMRAEAAFLANELVAAMNQNISDNRAFNVAGSPRRSFPITAARYGYTPPSAGGSAPAAPAPIASWVAKAQQLPGVTSKPELLPKVEVISCVKGTVNARCPAPFNTTAAGAAYATVSVITMQWQMPNATTPRQHQTQTYFMYDALDN